MARQSLGTRAYLDCRTEIHVSQKNALPVTRQEDFAAWYQAVIQEADLAEESGVRGCMIMRPWG